MQLIQSLMAGVGAQATGTIQINGMPPMPFPVRAAVHPEGASIRVLQIYRKARQGECADWVAQRGWVI